MSNWLRIFMYVELDQRSLDIILILETFKFVPSELATDLLKMRLKKHCPYLFIKYTRDSPPIIESTASKNKHKLS